MTFLTTLGVTEILCSSMLVLERKTGKEIPKSSRQSSQKSFQQTTCFIRCRRQQLKAIEQRRSSRFTFYITLLATGKNSQGPSLCKVIKSSVLAAYASLTASRTILQQLLACLNFNQNLDSKDLFCWYKQKKVISMNYGSST